MEILLEDDTIVNLDPYMHGRFMIHTFWMIHIECANISHMKDDIEFEF